MQPGLSLEPLAGEAQVDGCAGGRVDTAERQIAGLPDLHTPGVGGKDRPPDVVGPVLPDHFRCGFGGRVQ